MRYLSTWGAYVTDLVGAVSRGLAPDGCLYVPEELPRFDPDAIRGETVAGIAAELLAPFFKGSSLAPDLNALCEDTFDFPIPLVPLDNGSGTLSVLEMFHGPTAAFKDVGARFLAAVMGTDIGRVIGARQSPADHFGRHLWGYRRCGCRSLPHPAWHARGRAVSEGTGLSAAKASADLLVGQRSVLRGRRLFRSMPIPVEECPERSRLECPPPIERGPTASIWGDCFRRSSITPQPAFGIGVPSQPGELYRAHGQPGQCARVHLGPRHGNAIGDIILATNANRVLPEFLRPASGNLAAASGHWPRPWT